jgi:transcriptional regulator with XRE-family HTH domain
MGPTDKEQTHALRLARVEEKRAVKDLNKLGKRLEWVRTKLELTQRQVCDSTGIPYSSYCGREAGIRPELIEEFLTLSVFYNQLWKKKYTEGFPRFNGEEIQKISVEWLMFGYVDIESNAEEILDEYKLTIRKMEQDRLESVQESLRQIDMFRKTGG